MELNFRRGSNRIGVASFEVEGVSLAVNRYRSDGTASPALAHPRSLPGPSFRHPIPFPGESLDATYI